MKVIFKTDLGYLIKTIEMDFIPSNQQYIDIEKKEYRVSHTSYDVDTKEINCFLTDLDLENEMFRENIEQSLKRMEAIDEAYYDRDYSKYLIPIAIIMVTFFGSYLDPNVETYTSKVFITLSILSIFYWAYKYVFKYKIE